MSTNERVISPISSPSDAHGKLVEMNIVTSAPVDPLSPISPMSSDSTLSPLTLSDTVEAPLLPKHVSVSREESMPKKNFKLSSMSIDDDRPFKVVVIGAGFSGIIAGIRYTLIICSTAFCLLIL